MQIKILAVFPFLIFRGGSQPKADAISPSLSLTKREYSLLNIWKISFSVIFIGSFFFFFFFFIYLFSSISSPIRSSVETLSSFLFMRYRTVKIE